MKDIAKIYGDNLTLLDFDETESILTERHSSPNPDRERVLTMG